MVEWGTTIVKLACAYQLMYFVSMYFGDGFKKLKERNTRLDELRAKQIRSLEEQKEFLDLKYPKTEWKITWSMVLSFFIGSVKFVVFLLPVHLLFTLLNIHIPLWLAIPIIIVMPIIINWFLKKKKLNNDTFNDLIGGKKMTYITREEAAQILGIKPFSLQAYFKKGLLSRPVYAVVLEEVQKAKDRKRTRRAITPEEKLARKIAKAKAFIASVEKPIDQVGVDNGSFD